MHSLCSFKRNDGSIKCIENGHGFGIQKNYICGFTNNCYHEFLMCSKQRVCSEPTNHLDDCWIWFSLIFMFINFTSLCNIDALKAWLRKKVIKIIVKEKKTFCKCMVKCVWLLMNSVSRFFADAFWTSDNENFDVAFWRTKSCFYCCAVCLIK